MDADQRSRDLEAFREEVSRSWDELTRLVIDSPHSACTAETRLREGQVDPMAFVASLGPLEANFFTRLAYLAIGEGVLRALEYAEAGRE